MNSKDFFTEIGNDSPYMKIALQGFAGSGKTYTAALIAKGLHQAIKSEKPIVIFDTEKSSRFLKPLFAEAGIGVLVKESRQLIDLIQTMKLCAEGASDVLLIDSISHVWESFLTAYKEKKNRKDLQFQDWGVIKPTWKQEFSDPLVAAKFNILFTGRAGYEYANELNELTGKRDIYKSGIKMRVEGETAYEVDLLLLMERFERVLGNDPKEVWREGTVLKDRSTLLDGQTFKNPAWTDFKPFYDFLCANVIPEMNRTEGDTTQLFNSDHSYENGQRQKKIILEKIEGVFDSEFPEARGATKKLKMAVILNTFNTLSQTEIQGFSLEKLTACLERLTEQIAEAKLNPDTYGVPTA
jgi:hypothetical protein